MKERNKATPAVYLILQKADKVLLMRRQGSGYYDGWYSLPAGHVDAGELPIQSLIRETKEEIGVIVDAQDLKLINTTYRTKSDETGDRADYFFRVDKWSGEPQICEPGKCDELRWCPINTLPEKTIYYIRKILEDVQKGITYSEFKVSHQQQ